MERILEPEYMNTPEETEGYDAMDHTEANRSFVDGLFTIRADQRRIVDLGTGPGHIPILIAQEAPDVQIVGVDAAEMMLVLAREKVAAAGLSERIELQNADVKSLPMADGAFDAVISNTILHHIPEPIAFLREAWRVCGAGGVLFIRDLFRPETEAEAWRLVDLHAKGANDQQRQLFYDSLHAALTLDDARDTVVSAGMPHASVEMTSDRHYTIVCLRPQ
jgi:ubiquinone/menaquinone biosynthesis C-methylase UbiE